ARFQSFTVPSWLPVASTLRSGANSKPGIELDCTGRTVCRNVARSRSLTIFALVTATVLASGDKLVRPYPSAHKGATLRIGAFGIPRSRVTGQSATVPSSTAAARTRPSGEKAIRATAFPDALKTLG